MPEFKTLDDLAVAGKPVLVRVDVNVPLDDGRVRDATRIERCRPTIEELADRGARVVLLSHLGRPGGKPVAALSLEPVAGALARSLGDRSVGFAADCIGAAARSVVAGLPDGGIALLENLRFHPGEEANDPTFAHHLAELGAAYVNDAFSVAHRAHASIEALPRLLPAAAGRSLQAELTQLSAALERPARPVAAIVGGAKVSTKLDLLGNLVDKADLLVIGGAMANTFLAARGFPVGASLCEPALAETARRICADAQAAGCEILLPLDAVVAAALKAGLETRTVAIEKVPPDRMILDIGPGTAEEICRRLAACRTLIWNGPLGCFETPPFDAGTKAVALAAAALTRGGRLRSVAGGGDTLAALTEAGVADAFSYLSTAGGAFLAWLEGKSLPGIRALERAAGDG
ncbi:MAG: phosphoglycerate kinase [Kiloniellales bacterium]